MVFTSSPTGKWLGFVTAIWVQAISGINYTFSDYSDALKSIMGLTQFELNNLSVAKDVGIGLGLLPGLASDRLPTQILLLIGSIEGFIGFGVQWLVVSQRIRPLPYWQMCIFLCMGGNSSPWMHTAILVTCLRNFQKNRGPVAGLLRGYVGLSTAIFTDLCSALFSDSPSALLLILTIVPGLVCFTAIIFLREIPPAAGAAEEKEETQFFNVFNAIAVLVAVHLLVFDVTGNHSRALSVAFAIVLLILLATPLAVPMYLLLPSSALSNSNSDLGGIKRQIEDPLLVQEIISETQQKPVIVTAKTEEVKSRRTPVIGEDHTLMEAMRNLDFWILFVSFLCGVGTGMAVNNNMGQIGLALGYTDVSTFVSLLSICGFFGRIVSGSVSEYFLKKAATPRPLWNAATQILMAAGYIFMAISSPGSLYVGSIVIGFCYGVRLSLVVPTASELFGLKYFGLFYNVILLNLPIGSFLFSGLLAGFLYDAQATRTPSGATTCVGGHCYRLVFVIMAFASILGFGLEVLLTIRLKNLYYKIHAR